MSIVGLFRGLGIVDSKFVGAPNDTITVNCVAYAMSVINLGFSGLLALLPLTIDRAIAVLLPLKHKLIITKKTCLLMFGVNWLPIVASLIHDTIAYIKGTIDIEYDKRYHRCVGTGRYSEITNYKDICLIFVPIVLLALMYGMMLFIIIKTKQRCGRFLITATGIIMTSILSYSPSIIADIFSIPLSYEVSQILTVTVFYLNGVFNPLIYVLAHPMMQKHIKAWWTRKTDFGVSSSANQNSSELTRDKNKHSVPEPKDAVRLPNMNEEQ